MCIIIAMSSTEPDILISLNRIAASLESAADSLACLCAHLGAIKPAAKRSRRAKGDR